MLDKTKFTTEARRHRAILNRFPGRLRPLLSIPTGNREEPYKYYHTYYDTMKHVHVTLEDWEAEELEKVKGNRTWHDLLMSFVPDRRVKGED